MTGRTPDRFKSNEHTPHDRPIPKPLARMLAEPSCPPSASHIVSATFYPVKSEVMLHALEEKGICVSSGSACSSNKPGLSGTLQSIGLSAKEADCTVRFSFSKYNTAEEVDYTLEKVRETYEVLRRFTSH